MALIIVAAHIQQLLGSHIFDIASRITVIFFFTMSGYFISHSCIHNIRFHGYFSWQDYTKGRVLKIMAPLFMIVLVCAFVGFAFTLSHIPLELNNIEFRPDLGKQLLSLFSLGLYGNINTSMAFPFWFMTVLIRCYVVIGILFFLSSSKTIRPIKFLVTLFLVFYIYRSLRIHLDALHEVTINIYHMGYICFFGGVAISYAKKLIMNYKFTVGALSVLILLGIFVYSSGWKDYNDPDSILYQIAVGLTFALSLPILGMVKLPHNRLIKGLSDISYYLYVVHQPINIVMGLVFYVYISPHISPALFMYVADAALSIMAAITLKIITERTIILTDKLTSAGKNPIRIF